MIKQINKWKCNKIIQRKKSFFPYSPIPFLPFKWAVIQIYNKSETDVNNIIYKISLTYSTTNFTTKYTKKVYIYLCTFCLFIWFKTKIKNLEILIQRSGEVPQDSRHVCTDLSDEDLGCVCPHFPQTNMSQDFAQMHLYLRLRMAVESFYINTLHKTSSLFTQF